MALSLLVFVSCATQKPLAKTITQYLNNPESSLPKMVLTSTAADALYKMHQENGGATYSMRYKDLSGQKLFVVSLFPDLGLIIEGKDIKKSEIIALIDNNKKLLKDPRVCVGSWFNSSDGKSYLDINVVLADKDEAIALGRKYNQISIFNLATFQETATGGNGKPIEGLPKPIKRLPKL